MRQFLSTSQSLRGMISKLQLTSTDETLKEPINVAGLGLKPITPMQFLDDLLELYLIECEKREKVTQALIEIKTNSY